MSRLFSGIRFWTLVVLWTASSTASWAQNPWGYLWDLRTARLYPLRGDSIRIGRLSQSDVVLSDPRVSRRHAEILRGTDGVVVLDRGSTNGSLIDGEPLPPGKAHELKPGSLLTFAYERLLYHESQEELWQDVVQHTLLGSLVELRVLVLADRTVKALGRERLVEAVSHAAVDLEKLTVKMQYPEDAVRGQQTFQPKERAFVGDVIFQEGELRLSLWGLARGGSLVSRRASLSHLKHGELSVGLAAETRREAQKAFEDKWTSEGAPFLLAMLGGVFGGSNREGLAVAVKISRSLLEQEGAVAPRDAARSLALLHRHDPTNKDIPVLAARAEAQWVKRVLEERRGIQLGEEREDCTVALHRAKKWLEKASELKSSRKDIGKAKAEIDEAEKRLKGSS